MIYIFIFLFQTIQYITRSKVIETETRELSSVSRGKIRFSETDDWKNEKLFVPPLPPTNLRGCHLIRIQYDVFVSGKNIVMNRVLVPDQTRLSGFDFINVIVRK